jgi:acetolactate synthase-1/2/3 large subunit
LVVGEAAVILRGVTERLAGPARPSLRDDGVVGVGVEQPQGDRLGTDDSSGPNEDGACADEFARAIARGLHAVPSAVIVDDSQMFGGLLARNYRHLPASVRVFGSHGGFVGGGLATAVGLAVAQPGTAVVATLGDQGFTNGVQALAALREQQAGLLVLVCNNGSSVSLTTQAAADGVDADTVRSALGNVPGLGYARIAAGFGIPATTLVWPDDPTGQDLTAVSRRLTAEITEALTTGGTRVLELLTPASPRFWAGVWGVAGFEDAVAAPMESGLAGDRCALVTGSRAVTAVP